MAVTPTESDNNTNGNNVLEPHKDLTDSDSPAADARPYFHWDTLEKVKEVLGSILLSGMCTMLEFGFGSSPCAHHIFS